MRQLNTVTTSRLANRIQWALAARQEETTKYLEDGQPDENQAKGSDPRPARDARSEMARDGTDSP
jgi:hypothetical protein